MADSPSTRPSLLVHIRDSRNGQAWSQFVEIYAPLIYGFARRHGLQDADAADLTQEVLHTVTAAVKKLDYDPQRGSFRGWLFTVVRNKLRNFVATGQQPARATGNANMQNLLEDQPARQGDQIDQWNEQYQQRLFACAAEQVRRDVRDSTWQAFWQTAVEGKRGKDVAERLKMSAAAVYLAKGRVMTRLKDRIRRLQDERLP